MLVALPAAIAYGVAVYSVVGPAYVAEGVRAGIIGAVVVGLLSAAIGGAPRLISSPSAPAAAVLASVAAFLLGPAHAIDPMRTVALLSVIAAGAGVLQIAFGAIGGGRLIKFIPYPVVSGYLSAVGVMIFLSQVPKFLGVKSTASALTVATSPGLWHWPALVVGSVTAIAMIAAPKITRRIPAAIIALACGAAAYAALGLFDAGLRTFDGNGLVIGPLAGGAIWSLEPVHGFAASLRTLTVGDLRVIVWPAATLSVLLSVDSLKTCVIVDALTFGRHEPDRTLIGQGLGNAVAALFGGMPGSGTMGATLVNNDSGGQTRWSGVLEGIFVLLAVVLLGRWLAWLPVSALAGILVVVAFRMFDWRSLQLIRQRSTLLDFAVIATVVIVAVSANLIAAAGAGVGLAMILFIRDQVRGTVIRRKTHGNLLTSKQPRLPAERTILDQFGSQITVCELQGSLFFGTTDQLYHELKPELSTCRFLILDLRRVQTLDYTATHLFGQFEAMLTSRNGNLLFSRLPPRPELREYLSARAAGDPRRNSRTFATLDDALQWAEDQILAEHLPARTSDAEPLQLAEFDLVRELEANDGISALATCVVERSYIAGAVLFEAGQASDELFLVRRGTIRVTLPLGTKGYHTLATFGRGHFFGEMAFLVRGRRSATAVATSATDVYVISRAEFDAVSHRNPIVGLKIFARLARMLAERLRRADAELRMLYDA